MQGVPDDISNLKAVFSETPGDDHVLIDWEPMCSWFDDLADVSPMIHVETIGESTHGRELKLICISSAETISTLDEVRESRRNLANAALLADPDFAQGFSAGTKPILLITAGIHATEVGGVQMMPALVRDLVSDPTYQVILDRMIVLIVPTLNPDGMALVHEWYRGTLGTASEGTSPPALYHTYAGHDNNRDWYQHRLAETRAVVGKVHNVWRPHVVLDLHQMGTQSPRYVMPPYIDPVEPHVHPLITQLSSELGTHVASAHVRAGNQGVCSGVLFDCYSPTRAYQHYHGGVRVLAEAASCHIASPVSVHPEEVNTVPGVTPYQPTTHCPLPWLNSSWHLADIIRYHRTTVDALLQTISASPERWIADQWRILADQVRATSGSWVIDPLAQQIDPAAARELITILQRGDVDILVATHDAAHVSAGSFVIPMQQPFGSYAAALLDLTPFPAGSQSYDVTSHCLPIHMGVETRFHPHGTEGETRPLQESDLMPFQPALSAEIEPNVWLALDPRSHATVRLVNHAIATGSIVRRLVKPTLSRQRLIPAGSWLICDGTMWDIKAHAAEMQIRTWVVNPIARGTNAVSKPKVALYDPLHVGISDFGWLRLWCERGGFETSIITSEDILHGRLQNIDTLLFPHGPAETLIKGHTFPQYPQAYTHGLSDRVMAELSIWMHRGGHVIAFGDAVTALSRRLELEIHQPLRSSKKQRKFSSSGAIVATLPTNGDELMLGIVSPFPVMHMGTAGYSLSDTGRQHSVARFSPTQPVVSGAVTGEEHIAGLHAIIQLHRSHGLFTAFAFRPHFRTQMLASELPLVNAIFQLHLHNGASND